MRRPDPPLTYSPLRSEQPSGRSRRLRYLSLLVNKSHVAVWAGHWPPLALHRHVVLHAALSDRPLALWARHGGKLTAFQMVLEGRQCGETQSTLRLGLRRDSRGPHSHHSHQRETSQPSLDNSHKHIDNTDANYNESRQKHSFILLLQLYCTVSDWDF